MITHENTLSERERYVLNALAAEADPATSRRAKALLQWSQGDSEEQIASANGLRASQVHSLTRAFAQKRLEVFAPSSIERASRGVAGCTTVDQLLSEQHVDPAHARYVAELALQIFDATASVHQLDASWRRLLETGALLHNIGSAQHDDHHERVGRDLILTHELEGFTPRERDILACLALFHRKKVKASRDAIFAALDAEAQRSALALAAILRVADGLDSSMSQSTVIRHITVDALVDAVVEGPNAEADARRSNKKAGLWRETLSPPFHARLPDDARPEPRPQKPVKGTVEIKPSDPIDRAGRKIIAVQLARVMQMEDKVRKDGDVNAIHDMRVATRRIRSAFRLLARSYPKGIKKLRGPVRELAGLLGQVRDLDVMLENLRAYLDTLSLEQQRSLDPLLTDWQARRAHALRSLVEYLDSKEYDDWTARMENWVESDERSKEPRVADVVPALLWKRYGAVRKYEPQVKQPSLATLHRLRIQCKRMRYALEFFSEALGDQTVVMLDPLVALQDHLGLLHDAQMASDLVTEFIAARARQAQRRGGETPNLEGTAAYLNALATRMKELEAGFPERWQVLLKPAFRQALGEAVASL